jgi:6-phosphofructokinase 1
VPKQTVAILTGGGDVPGLNPAIRAITIRALRDGFRVLGIRRGWGGLVDFDRRPGAENSDCVIELTEDTVNRAGRTGGTFLHSSRTNPKKVPRAALPAHLVDQYAGAVVDVTPDVLKNIEHLKIDSLIAIGGDDTLGYAQRLHQEGVKVVAIPKTMDNDVPGTDYSIGFSTCVTRTIELTHRLRTSAGSHERFLVLEVFGRYAGFSALLPTMAGASDRCVIPEHPFNIERLAELLTEDRRRNPSKYSVVLVSEGARLLEQDQMMFEGEAVDQFGHRKLGGIGEHVSEHLKELSPRFNNGRTIGVVFQRLGYLVRSGDPDGVDSIVGMAFGNHALDLVQAGRFGRLVALRKGCYDSVPLETVTATKKVVNVEQHYNVDRLRPMYRAFEGLPMFIMGWSDGQR